MSSTSIDAPADPRAPAARAERHAWALLAAMAVALAAAGAAVYTLGLDRALMPELQGYTQHVPDVFWASLSVLALGLGVAIVAGLCSPQRHPLPMAGMLWALALGGAALHGVKHWVAAPRPAGVLPPDALHVIGQRLMAGAMPSGHAAAAFGLAVLLVLALPAARRWAVPIACGGLLAALSRIAVGAHWPSDVLVGAGIGTASALLALWIEARWSVLTARLATPVGQRVLALLQVVLGIAMALQNTGYPSAWAMQYALAAASVVGGGWRWARAGARG